jgi:hypothetical protein
VLLVDHALFKVHRSMLTKDNSSFEEMFSLDEVRSNLSPDQQLEGQDDDNPIHLQGDTSDEFRALLWSLYALPAELVQLSSPDGYLNTMRFIHLARIAHKYQFRTTERWALQVLITYTKRTDSQNTSCLEQLTEVASLCACPELLNDAVARWKTLLAQGRDVALAIGLGERLGLKKLTGLAYHKMMIAGRSIWDADPILTRSQKVRLLSGYYTLSHLCESLPSQPPSFSHDSSCVVARCCAATWLNLWKVITSDKEDGFSDQVTKLQPGDLLGRVMMAESILRALVDCDIPRNGMMDGMHEICGELALKAVQKKVREVQKQLVDYFVDVE